MKKACKRRAKGDRCRENHRRVSAFEKWRRATRVDQVCASLLTFCHELRRPRSSIEDSPLRSATKEANVLIKSRQNVKTSPSCGVFAIFRKFRLGRARESLSRWRWTREWNRRATKPPRRCLSIHPAAVNENKRSRKNKRAPQLLSETNCCFRTRDENLKVLHEPLLFSLFPAIPFSVPVFFVAFSFLLLLSLTLSLSPPPPQPPGISFFRVERIDELDSRLVSGASFPFISVVPRKRTTPYTRRLVLSIATECPIKSVASCVEYAYGTIKRGIVSRAARYRWPRRSVIYLRILSVKIHRPRSSRKNRWIDLEPPRRSTFYRRSRRRAVR